MRPHEQTWKYEVKKYGRGTQGWVIEEGCNTVCHVTSSAGMKKAEDRDEQGRLIAAAPEMARALLEVLAEHSAQLPHTSERIEEILRKAGVLP